VPLSMSTPEVVLKTYAEGPATLQAAVKGLAEADLDLSRGAGTWTIRQIVHHLADSEGLWATCLKMAIGAPDSSFKLDWYPGNDVWAEALSYERRTIEPAVVLVRENRSYIAGLAEQLLERWQQKVEVEGPAPQGMGVGEVIGLLSAHLDRHVEQIRTIRQLHGR
jgi:uncharacterized damage-inducible protein DinB